jgi:heme o synthase
MLFRRLAVVSAVGVVLPIALGGVVRATGSGDACPDWPRCFGRWIPPANYQAILEYSHRLSAAVSGLLLLALAIALLRDRALRSSKSLVVPAVVAFVLLIVQSYLGKLVVERSLSPGLVTVHLATALTLAATVTVAAVNAFFVGSQRPESAGDTDTLGARAAPPGASPGRKPAATSEPALQDGTTYSVPERKVFGLGLAAVASIAVVVLVGAYLRAESASLAFLDWPLMGGRIIPAMTTEPERVHFAHRLLVAIGLVPVIWYAVALTRAKPRIVPAMALAHSAATFYVVEIALGAANVLTRLDAWARAGHVIFASAALMTAVASVTYVANSLRLRSPGKLSAPTAAAPEPVKG